MGTLVASVNGTPIKAWTIRVEHLTHPWLSGIWLRDPETQQIAVGETVTGFDEVIYIGSYVDSGANVGLPYPQVLRRSVPISTGSIAGWLASGWLALGADSGWFRLARQYPYPITETVYETQNRYTFRLEDSSYPLVEGYPDEKQTVQTDWLSEESGEPTLDSEWFPTLLCDPDAEITCGTRFSQWCCVDCADLAEKLKASEDKLKSMSTRVRSLTVGVEQVIEQVVQQ